MRDSSRRLSPARRARFLAYLVWLHSQQAIEHATEHIPQARRSTDVPVAFAIIASLSTFVLLYTMPHKALGLIVASGTGLSVSIIALSLRRVFSRVYWVGR